MDEDRINDVFEQIEIALNLITVIPTTLPLNEYCNKVLSICAYDELIVNTIKVLHRHTASSDVIAVYDSSRHLVDERRTLVTYAAIANEHGCIVRTTADGSCLFHAISLAIFGNEEPSLLLRLICAKYFAKYHEVFNDAYVTTMLDFESVQQLIHWTVQCETQNSWGGSAHIQILADVFLRDIYLYQGFQNSNMHHLIPKIDLPLDELQEQLNNMQLLGTVPFRFQPLLGDLGVELDDDHADAAHAVAAEQHCRRRRPITLILTDGGTLGAHFSAILPKTLDSPVLRPKALMLERARIFQQQQQEDVENNINSSFNYVFDTVHDSTNDNDNVSKRVVFILNRIALITFKLTDKAYYNKIISICLSDKLIAEIVSDLHKRAAICDVTVFDQMKHCIDSKRSQLTYATLSNRHGRVVKTTDGTCNLFNAISLATFGNELASLLLRLVCVKCFATYPAFFNNESMKMCFNYCSIKDLIRLTAKHNTPLCYDGLIHMQVLADVFFTQIYVYYGFMGVNSWHANAYRDCPLNELQIALNSDRSIGSVQNHFYFQPQLRDTDIDLNVDHADARAMLLALDGNGQTSKRPIMLLLTDTDMWGSIASGHFSALLPIALNAPMLMPTQIIPSHDVIFKKNYKQLTIKEVIKGKKIGKQQQQQQQQPQIGSPIIID